MDLAAFSLLLAVVLCVELLPAVGSWLSPSEDLGAYRRGDGRGAG